MDFFIAIVIDGGVFGIWEEIRLKAPTDILLSLNSTFNARNDPGIWDGIHYDS